MHTPVLLKEVLQELDVKRGDKYIDATYGEGGHSREILKRGGVVLAFEWDKSNYELKNNNEELRQQNLILVNENFANIEAVAKNNEFDQVAGILFDLGLSMEQIARSGRGFSFKNDMEPLDMRIGKDLQETAADILNTYEEEELTKMFIKNSEELKSEKIAKALVQSRHDKKIISVGDLVEIVRANVNSSFEREAVLRRIFQALRIEVNYEYDNLEKGLTGSLSLLKAGGKLLVITFHPSEDRFVKKFFQKMETDFDIKKIIQNPKGGEFERSAKLRAAIKN